MNIKEKNTSNIFLMVILQAILVALVILCVNQRSSIQNAQESHDRLYELMKNYVGHVQAVNLIAEGRRGAFAELFADQVFKGASTHKKEELLEYGVEGINAYLSLKGNNIVQGVKNFTLSNPLYLFQMEISQVLVDGSDAYKLEKQKKEGK